MKKLGQLSIALLIIMTVKAKIYNNVFISYYSPLDVQSMVKYNKQNNINGYIFWDIRSDLNPQNNQSLLGALKNSVDEDAFIMGYYPNWGVYNTATKYAIDAFPVPGSHLLSGEIAKNEVFSAQLAGKYYNHLAYAFLEAQTENDHLSPQDIGVLYFNDPWADLLPNDDFCENENPICNFVGQKRGIPFKSSAYMGNFEAFAQLPEKYPSMQTLISVGGYGHDKVFEDTFQSVDFINNFVESAKSIMDHYHINGIDLDYENPAMSNEQSRQYLTLIQALDKILSPQQYITVTILANQKNMSSSTGFAPGILQSISELNHVAKINLMTYDFHGAFDFQSSGKTGFMSNLLKPTNIPANYDPEFSVADSITGLSTAGVAKNKISVGIPAYGRTLAQITPGNDNTGLFQPILAGNNIVAGNLDDKNCDPHIPMQNNACSGTFTYSFIVNKMIPDGFIAKDWLQNNFYIGSTAYNSTWNIADTPDYKLILSNNNRLYGLDYVKISNNLGEFISDYIPNNSAKTYSNDTNPSIRNLLLNPKELVIKYKFTNYDNIYTCKKQLNFDNNYKIEFYLDADCSIKVMDYNLGYFGSHQ